MRERIDSDQGKEQYGRRFATVEPAFGNVRHNNRLHRFTLRGQKKVDGQWKLLALVHNLDQREVPKGDDCNRFDCPINARRYCRRSP
ncbi:MAG: transposase [Dokdonella sp.]